MHPTTWARYPMWFTPFKEKGTILCSVSNLAAAIMTLAIQLNKNEGPVRSI